MPVISTVAAPNSNSYLSMAEVESRIVTDFPEWEDMSDLERENLVIRTGMKIARIRCIGTPYYARQALHFPAVGDVYVEQDRIAGGEVYVGEIPAQITEEARTPVGVDHGQQQFNWEAIAPDPGFAAPTTYLILSFEFQGLPYTNVRITLDGAITEVHPLLSVYYVTGTNAFIFDILESNLWVENVSGVGDSVDYEKVLFSDAVLDADDNLPDFYKNGSVHVVYASGDRTYHDIAAHNGITGIVTLATPYNHGDVSAFFLHPPILKDVTEAQYIQILAETGAIQYDPFLGAGIGKIQIDDSSRSYMQGQYGTMTVRDLAARNQVHEQVFARMGHLTVYGKQGLIFAAPYEEMLGITTSDTTEDDT